MQKSLRDIFKDVPNVDSRSAQFLINALEKNNQPGFDYLEYKQSIGALAALDIDENTAFKSAFATASTVGLTKDKLLKTAQLYLKVLENERTQFDDAVKQQINRQIAGKQQQSQILTQSIDQKHKQIEKLKAEILQSQAKIVQLKEEIDGAKGKIGATKQNFENTFAIIQDEIKNDIGKIEAYLL